MLKTIHLTLYLLLLQQTWGQLWKVCSQARLTWNHNTSKYVAAKTNQKASSSTDWNFSFTNGSTFGNTVQALFKGRTGPWQVWDASREAFLAENGNKFKFQQMWQVSGGVGLNSIATSFPGGENSGWSCGRDSSGVTSGEIFQGKGCQTLKRAAQGDGGVTVPGGA